MAGNFDRKKREKFDAIMRREERQQQLEESARQKQPVPEVVEEYKPTFERSRILSRSVLIFSAVMAVISLFSLIMFGFILSSGVNVTKAAKSEKLNEYVTAQKYYEKALRWSKGSTKALAGLYYCQFMNRDLEGLEDTWERLSDGYFADWKFGSVGVARERVEKTIELIEKLSYPSDWFKTQLEETKDMEPWERADFLLSYCKDRYERAGSLSIVADMYLQLNEYQTAIEILRDLFLENQTAFDAAEILLDAYYSQGMYYEASRIVRMILSQHTEIYSAYAWRARIDDLMEKKNAAMALTNAQKAYSHTPDDPFVVATMSIVYYCYNDTAKANQFYEQLKDMDPDYFEIGLIGAVLAGEVNYMDGEAVFTWFYQNRY